MIFQKIFKLAFGQGAPKPTPNMNFSEVLKGNPNHDENGQFAAASKGPMTLHRGHGSGPNRSGAIEWVTPDKKLAEGYASKRTDGTVTSKDYHLKATFDVGRDALEMTPSKFAVKAMTQAKSNGTVTDKEALSLRAEFLKGHDAESRKVSDYWAHADGKVKVASLLTGLGFDSIHLTEDGVSTYGILQATTAKKAEFAMIMKANPYHDKAGRFAPKESKGSGDSESGSVGSGTMKPGTFKGSMSDYFRKHDDPKVTARSILAHYQASDRAEISVNIAKAQRDPSSKHIFVKNGEYTAERQKLHDEIIDSYINEANITRCRPADGKSPTYVVLGGRGGSGKSSFTNGKIKEFDSAHFLNLNSDDIKERLRPPYKGWNAFSVHEESSDVFDAVMKRAQELNLNIINDATLRNARVGDTFDTLKKSGYSIEGHYMFAPRQEAAKRAVNRYLKKGPEARGRLVPVDVILDNTRNEEVFDSLKPHFTKWSAYDNQVVGRDPVLINRSKKK